jgi:uncharacterized protein YjbJ (UPF0337 family)
MEESLRPMSDTRIGGRCRLSRRRSETTGIFGTAAQPAALSAQVMQRRFFMDREHIKGAAEKAKGAVKETAGKLTGDKELQAEGKLDKAKGEAHKIAGDVKDAVRDRSS